MRPKLTAFYFYKNQSMKFLNKIIYLYIPNLILLEIRFHIVFVIKLSLTDLPSIGSIFCLNVSTTTLPLPLRNASVISSRLRLVYFWIYKRISSFVELWFNEIIFSVRSLMPALLIPVLGLQYSNIFLAIFFWLLSERSDRLPVIIYVSLRTLIIYFFCDSYKLYRALRTFFLLLL